MDSSEDIEDIEDIKDVKDILQNLIKAKKTLRMYPQNNPIYVMYPQNNPIYVMYPQNNPIYVKTLVEDSYMKFKSFFDYKENLILKIQLPHKKMLPKDR